MKVVGIIAEYNPFHNGHQYQIRQLRQKTNADYIIIAMSGNFLQRGVPALCDKYTRTKMALECGADLVLEIPVLWASASAEYFAHGAISLLNATGVITHLGFGAESTNLDALLSVSSILKEEPETYRFALSDALRLGYSFPAARKKALAQHFPSEASASLEQLLDQPNNILALEYLKALPEHITPVLIPRKGAGYHDTQLETVLPSATAIRNALFTDDALSAPASAMPKAACRILNDYRNSYACMEADDFSSMLGYQLQSQKKDGFSNFADCTVDFSNKIQKHLHEYTTFEDFAQTLKSKDMTYTRISRCLTHILLQITEGDYTSAKALGYTPYLRILGFQRSSGELLSAIKKNSTLPLLSKVADAESILSRDAFQVFGKDLFASALYYQCMANKSHTRPLNEYTQQIVIR